MKRVELYRWYVVDGMFRRRRLTTYHMSPDEAARRFPGAVREPRTWRYQFMLDKPGGHQPETRTLPSANLFNLPDLQGVGDRSLRGIDRAAVVRPTETEDRSRD